MMNLLGFGPIKSAALAVAALALICGGVYIKGRTDGKAAVYSRLASDRVKILKDGKEIDQDVYSANDNDLCNMLGGC